MDAIQVEEMVWRWSAEVQQTRVKTSTQLKTADMNPLIAERKVPETCSGHPLAKKRAEWILPSGSIRS
jgi:hypothetical protein